MSWWKHLEAESAILSNKFGVSQVWLPPPSKAAKPSGQGYDAYDLVRVFYLSVFSRLTPYGSGILENSPRKARLRPDGGPKRNC